MTRQLTTGEISSLPLHELMSRILGAERPLDRTGPTLLPTAGTLRTFHEQLKKRPVADFADYILRGIGQVIFVNNPISGGLILLALLIQSPWVALLGLIGVLASTLTAIGLRLDRETIRNGIFGYNGVLVGAALATFSNPEVGAGYWGWAIAAILFAALTTVLMNTLGIWWAKTVQSPALTLPFNIATLICLVLVQGLPQLGLALGVAVETPPAELSWLGFSGAVPIGFGQVFLADQFLSGLLILLAVAICTPLGALVGLVGVIVGTTTGWLLGVSPNAILSGLWGYNALLCAMAIGGVFYAPTSRSVLIGAIAAVFSSLLGVLLGPAFAAVGLPLLTVPFCIVTILCFVVLRRQLPSLVPVALHAVTSPEEHQHRYQAAKTVITNFRHQLVMATQKSHAQTGNAQTGNTSSECYLFNVASNDIKGDLRYLFNLIDTDQNHALSTQELSMHLQRASQVASATELNYLFSRMDRNGDGSVDFEEFGELMLRHRRLMANYDEFVTYFLPIDADGDDAISIEEMNVAMKSVGAPSLSKDESLYLAEWSGGRSLTWNQFIEMMLIT